MTNTKIKQRARAQAKRSGASKQPAKRATRENLGKFAPGQKLRNGEPMAERYTAAIVRGASLTRTLAPRARQKLASEPLAASSDKPRAKPTRKRTQLRAAGMRYVRETEPGLNINPPGRWVDATGNGGIPTIGTARVYVRRMAAQFAHAIEVERRKAEMISVGDAGAEHAAS